MGVIDVVGPILIAGTQLGRRENENVVTIFGSFHERGFFAGAATGEKVDAAAGYRAVQIRSRSAAAHAWRLELVRVDGAVSILRNKPVGAIEEEPTRVREVARLAIRLMGRWP
jgi:hypothetical protein